MRHEQPVKWVAVVMGQLRKGRKVPTVKLKGNQVGAFHRIKGGFQPILQFQFAQGMFDRDLPE